MKKKLLVCFSLFICLFSLLSFVVLSVSAQPKQPLPIQRGEIKELEKGVYALFDNYTQFNGGSYEYNLDDFFDESYVNYYTYAITTSHPDDGTVVIDENILIITPAKPFEKTIMITATEKNSGEVLTTEFRLKFINSIEYMTGKIVSWLFGALWVLALLLILNYCIPIKGRVSYAQYSEGEVTLIDGATPRWFWHKMSGQYSITGRFRGVIGKAVYFIPDTEVYVKNSDSDRIECIDKVRIPLGDSVVLYTDFNCIQGIQVKYLESSTK